MKKFLFPAFIALTPIPVLVVSCSAKTVAKADYVESKFNLADNLNIEYPFTFNYTMSDAVQKEVFNAPGNLLINKAQTSFTVFAKFQDSPRVLLSFVKKQALSADTGVTSIDVQNVTIANESELHDYIDKDTTDFFDKVEIANENPAIIGEEIRYSDADKRAVDNYRNHVNPLIHKDMMTQLTAKMKQSAIKKDLVNVILGNLDIKTEIRVHIEQYDESLAQFELADTSDFHITNAAAFK